MRQTLRRWAYGSPLYGWTLNGPSPTTVGDAAGLRRPGDAAAGAAMVEAGPGAVAAAARDPAADAFAVHRFDWLADVASAGDIAHWSFARDSVLAWVTANPRWHPAVSRIDVLGTRLANWLLYAAPLLARADDAFKGAFLQRLGRDVRHLRRALRRQADAGFAGSRGLLAAGCLLPGFEAVRPAALAALEKAVAAQLLGDGGHASRCPATHLAALDRLVDCRTLLDGRAPVPDWLQGACDRMAPALRAWRHRDGRLAVFAGGDEADEAAIERTLGAAVGPGRALDNLPHTGYQRLAAGRTTLIFDTGPGLGGAVRGSGAPLAFELSHGKGRLIVNCGAARTGMSAAWRRALGRAAAHSTLDLGDVEAQPRRPPTVARRKVDQHQLVEATSDGYAGLGVRHARSLYLAGGGLDVRGEDRLEGGDGVQPFALRFHLHPAVRASLAEGGSVLLRPEHGAGWRFRAAGGEVAVEDSVYAGDGRLRKSRQIVVTGAHPAAGETTVKWRLERA